MTTLELPEAFAAWVDAMGDAIDDSEEPPPQRCECGEWLDRDCMGNWRCPACDDPDSGPGPGYADIT